MPPARALVTTLEGAVEAVAALDPEPLLARIVRARELSLELAEPNLEQALVAAELLEVMTAFLGEDGRAPTSSALPGCRSCVPPVVCWPLGP